MHRIARYAVVTVAGVFVGLAVLSVLPVPDEGSPAEVSTMSLTRTVEGFLWRGHNTDDGWTFDASNWTPTSGTTVSVVGALRASKGSGGSGDVELIRLDRVTSRGKVFVTMALEGTGARYGVVAHISDLTNESEDCVAITIADFSGTSVLYERINGSNTNLQSTTAGGTATGTDRLAILVDGTTLVGWDSHTDNDWSDTAASHASGQVGFWASPNTFTVDMFSIVVGTDRYVTVTGLAENQIARIYNAADTLLASDAADGTGTATIDVLKMAPNGDDYLAIYESDGTTLVEEVAPAGGIVGGDTWEYSATDPAGGRIDDAAWNQWIEPRAVRYSGTYDRTYVGTVSADGTTRVSSYDHDSHAVVERDLATKVADDHGAPAILVDSDGYIWAFYTAHNSETTLYYRKSTNPEDLTNFGAEQSLTFDHNATYAQAFQNSDGRIIVFARQDSNDGVPHNNDEWAFRYTDNGGSTWSAAAAWADAGNWTYQVARQHRSDPDVLSVAFGYHPDETTTHEIYLATLNIQTGDVTVPGSATSLANIYTPTGLPFDPTTEAIEVYAPTGDDTVRLLDVSPNDEILFAEWDSTDLSTVQYHYVQVDSGGSVGTVRTLVSPGVVIDHDGSPEKGYFAGAGFADAEGVLVLAREEDDVWYIERWETIDGGANWSDTEISAGAMKRFRPVAVRGETGTPTTLWSQGGYASFLAYDTDVYLEDFEAGGVEVSTQSSPPELYMRPMIVAPLNLAPLELDEHSAG